MDKKEVNETQTAAQNAAVQETRWDRFIRVLSLRCADVGMAVIMIIVFLTLRHAIGRYFFNAPLTGNVDLTCFAVVVGIFLCIIYTMQQNGHIAVGLLVDALPKKAQNVIYVLMSILSVQFVIILAYETFQYAPLMAKQQSTLLKIPKGPFFYFVAVCWVLLGIVMASMVWRKIETFASRKLSAAAILIAVLLSVWIIAVKPLSGTLKNMNDVTAGIIGLVLFTVLMFLKMPVSISMGFAGLFWLGFYMGWGKALSIVAANPFSSLFNYTWSTVPMFVLMGYLAKNTQLAEEFYYGIRQWVGHLPGGLLHAVIIGNGAFGACSGDTLGAGVTFCSITLPETRKYGYDDTLTLGCIAGGSVLAALIPPSMLFIVFGATTQTSIGRLFMAGVFPGLLLIVMYILLITFIAKRKPNLAPRVTKVPRKEAWKATPPMLNLVLVFVIVIGGIYAGIFSPTEAGSFGAAAVMVIGLVRGKLKWKNFVVSLRETAGTLGMIGLLLAGSMIFQRLVVLTSLTTALGDAMLAISTSRYMFFLICGLLLLVLGCFIDALPLLMLMAPILLPVAEMVGIDPVHFGVFCVTVILIGTLTPPVGIMVYALAGVVPEVPMSRIFKGVMPFIAVMCLFAVIVAVWPNLSIWLVGQMFG